MTEPSTICWQCGWDKSMCKCYRNQTEEDNPYMPSEEELEDAEAVVRMFDRLQDEYKSTGWSSEYYELPEGATELQDLIEHREMNFAIGNIFKAAYRLGNKEGSSKEYDLNKIIWFAQRELNRVKNVRS